MALQKASLAGEKSAPHPTTPILCAPARRVGQEHRHFIVEGEIVTSSRYKLAGQPNFREGADQAVLDVVKHAIDIWQPAQAFVLDTYISGDDIGIVEIGCLTHAGLYEADLVKLVDRIDGMKVEMDASPQNRKIGGPGGI